MWDNYDKYEETDRAKYLEYSVELRRFPIDENGKFVATYPTRLGNLLTAYEEYPLRVYGMDSAFYWYRIWLAIDDDLREHVDSRQALADSTLYVSMALSGTGLLSLIYAVLDVLGVPWTDNLPPAGFLFALAFLALLGSYALYRSSMHLHAQVGEIFKALFDMYRDKVSVDQVINELAAITNDTSLLSKSSREKYMVAWHYLHNYRIKRDDGKVVTIAAYKRWKEEKEKG